VVADLRVNAGRSNVRSYSPFAAGEGFKIIGSMAWTVRPASSAVRDRSDDFAVGAVDGDFDAIRLAQPVD
jgi:hypothetical protein